MYILLSSVVIDILLTLTGQCSHTMLIIGTSPLRTTLGVRIYRAFPKRGGSGFSLIHGCYFMGGAPIPAARSPADTVGGPGGLPRGKFEKKIANGGI